MKHAYFIALCLLLAISSHAQGQHVLDSLQNTLNSDINDTTRINTLNSLAWELKFSNSDTAILICKQSLELAQHINWQKGIGSVFRNLGVLNHITGKFPDALDNFNKALIIREQLKDNKGIAATLSNIGIVYWSQAKYAQALKFYLRALKIDEKTGDKNRISADLINIGSVYKNQDDYPRALEFYFKALRIDEEIGANKRIATNLGNIGAVYSSQDNFAKSLEYYFKALKMDEEIGNKNGIARHLANIGIVYNNQGNYAKARASFLKALKIDEEIGDKYGIAADLGNIGLTYKNQGDSALSAGDKEFSMTDKYPKALEFYAKALEISEEIGDQRSTAINLGNIGSLYINTEKYLDAEKFLLRAVKLSIDIGVLRWQKEQHKFLSDLYSQTDRFQLALAHYKQYTTAKDSIFNEEKSKDLGRLEALYEFETAETEQKRAEEELVKQEATLKSRRDNLQYSGILIFLVLVFAGIFMLGRITIPIRLAEGMIFFAFLLFFEFTLVLLDPYIEQYSSGAPVIKLTFNALLAAFIFPLHASFETLIKRRLIK